ncbi:coiled-coil domain-containing protein 22 [Quillaja saponaria]|nr:coiled-coil domain-containing protein 22 [Quillaja saponaria]
MRFLVERLSESSESGRAANSEIVSYRSKRNEDDNRSSLEEFTKKEDNKGVGSDFSKVGAKLNDLRLKLGVHKFLTTEADHASTKQVHEAHLVQQKMDAVAPADASRSRVTGFCNHEVTSVLSGEDLAGGPVDTGRDAEETAAKIDNKDMPMLHLKVTSSEELSSKVRCDSDNLRSPEKVLMAEVTAKTSELQHLEQELELLKAATKMAFDNQHTIDFYLELLNGQVDSRRCYLLELESEWDAVRKQLEERKRSLGESLYANNPCAQEMLQKWREVELERQSIVSEIRKREEEHSKLTANLEKQPKLVPRKSYIQRIKEITKNSRKQDADIERILKETRELQLESNSIQERLYRTYAVADEIIFREAKKDPIGRQAYRLLTSMHESFEQISEKILATDRIQREVAEHEMKLAAMASRSLNVDKLQADLDAIRRENEYLEQQFWDK